MDLQEVGWGHGLYRAGLGYGQVVGTCECGNGTSGSIKCRELFYWLKTVQFLKKMSAEWKVKLYT
jgi:hypothetical protein